MDMYKRALQINLTIKTEKGELNLYQLFVLNLASLKNAIIAYSKMINKDNLNDLDGFFDEENIVDERTQLAFDILKDIYKTKKEEIESTKKSKEDKLHNEKIKAIIASKQEENLQNLPIEELEKLLKK